jgi:hypothetical protein
LCRFLEAAALFAMSDPVVVVASAAEHPGSGPVWGTGGWTPPAEREARDWVALCRLLGWGVTLASGDVERIEHDVRWVLIACDPDEVGERLAERLAQLLQRQPVLVVARAARSGSPLARIAGCARSADEAGGRRLRWHGPGEALEWELEDVARSVRLDGAGEVWLTLDHQPAAIAQPFGPGVIATLGVHPSEARDAGGAMTAALRTMLTHGVPGTSAWLDMEGALALRMDDPGGSQNVHLDPFAYRELGPDDWRALAAVLRGHSARLGVAAVPAWVDDGDASRGELAVHGEPGERAPGRTHPSWDVTYLSRSGHLHDYAGEFALLRELAREGVIDIALHGHTHMHPDLEAWATASDRHTAVEWYREFGAPDGRRTGSDDPLGDGISMLTQFFGAPPAALVFPGDAWTDAALERALELDLSLVASYYVALRDGDRFIWAEQVRSPYLDEPAESWFHAGVPVVGYFHARDVSEAGVGWVRDLLDRWAGAGARRMVGLGELAFALNSRIGWDAGSGEGKLIVSTPPGAIRHALCVRLHGESIGPGARIETEINGREGLARVGASVGETALVSVAA